MSSTPSAATPGTDAAPAVGPVGFLTIGDVPSLVQLAGLAVVLIANWVFKLPPAQ